MTFSLDLYNGLDHVFLCLTNVSRDTFLTSLNFAPFFSLCVDKHRRHVCEDCDGRLIIGDVAWKAHLSSKKHKKMKAGRERRLEVKALAAAEEDNNS